MAGKSTLSAQLRALRAALKEGDERARLDAIAGLVSLGETEAVPALLKALKDDSHSVRAAAARALGALGDARAMEALFRVAPTLTAAEQALSLIVETARCAALGPLLVASNSKLPERAALAAPLKTALLASLSVEELAEAALAALTIKSEAGLNDLYELVEGLPLEHRLSVWLAGLREFRTSPRSISRIRRADVPELRGLLAHAEAGPPPPFEFSRDSTFSRRTAWCERAPCSPCDGTSPPHRSLSRSRGSPMRRRRCGATPRTCWSTTGSMGRWRCWRPGCSWRRSQALSPPFRGTSSGSGIVSEGL